MSESLNNNPLNIDPQIAGLIGMQLMNGGQINPLLAAALLNNESSRQQYPNPTPPAQYNGQSYNMPTLDGQQASNNKVEGAYNIDNIMNAIGQVESSGRYNAIGPTTRTGDRAYGRYQIMGANIPAWSKEALGRQVTPEDFINNPQLQDQIARYKMSQYHAKYGNPQDVASAWFSGRPMRNNYSADVTGTNVPEYVRRVSGYL